MFTLDVEFTFFAEGLKYVIVYGKYEGDLIQEGDILSLEDKHGEKFRVFEVPLTNAENGLKNQHVDLAIRPETMNELFSKGNHGKSKKGRKMAEERILKEISEELRGKRLCLMDKNQGI